MTFKSLLSQKQINSIFFFFVGIITLYFLFSENRAFVFLAKSIILATIVISILNFISETRRKYSISHPYQKNNYDSHKEEIIAEYFKHKNIIFIHNKIIKVPKLFLNYFNIPFVNEQVKPDFFLPEFNVYVEYCGLMGNLEYKERYNHKKKLYSDNNLDVLWLYERDLYQKHEKDYSKLDWCFTQKLLEIFKTRERINRHF